MCLAIPSKIVEINDNMAVIDADGVRRECSLLLLEDPAIGDYVIVHAGFAIHKIDEEAAMESLKLLKEASDITGLKIVTEVITPTDVLLVAKYADVIQVGARNMTNFSLLKDLGKITKPVILKRGLSATVQDLLMAAEYIVSEGNPNVILCERGIKTFEPATRNTLDLSIVPYLRQRSHLPVLVDPSHGTGIRELIAPMSMAAAACGADGIIVEVIPL